MFFQTVLQPDCLWVLKHYLIVEARVEKQMLTYINKPLELLI